MLPILKTFALGCVVTAIALTGGGCSWAYLYDAKHEQATATAKDTFGKLKFDEFQDQRTYLNALATSENTAIKSFMLADRDHRVAALVKPVTFMPIDDKPAPQPSSLLKEIDNRLRVLVGVDAGTMTAQQLKGWSDLPGAISKNAVGVIGMRMAFEDARESYVRSRQDKAKVDDFLCPDVAKRLPPAVGNAEDYRQMGTFCTDLFEAETRYDSASKLGAAPGSDIDKAMGALAKVRERRQTNALAEKTIATQIEAALETHASSPASEALKNAIDQLRKALGNAQDAAKFLGAKVLSDELQKALTAHLVEALATLSPKAGEQGAAKKKDAAAATGTRGQAALGLASAFASAVDAASGQGKDVEAGSLLIAIAALRQRMDVARLEKERDQAQEQVRQGQVFALIHEASLLARARLFTRRAVATTTPLPGGLVDDWKNEGSSAAPALANYSQAWSEGRLPYYLGEFQVIQIDRAHGLEVAARTAANWKDLLAPALDQLVADGKGGIKPETIAQLLGNLGIMSSIMVP